MKPSIADPSDCDSAARRPQCHRGRSKLHDDAFVFDGHVHVIDRQFYHGGDIGERVRTASSTSRAPKRAASTRCSSPSS